MSISLNCSRCFFHLESFEKRLTSGIEFAGAILLVLEVVLLFSGVVARYVFGKPLLWSDETAAMLFIWLTMIGAVVALFRDEHMRLTVIVGRMRPAWRSRCETLASISILLFALLIILPSVDYASGQIIITQPVLNISDAWRASAIVVGLALMVLFSALRLLKRANVQDAILILLFIGAVSVVLWLLQATLVSLGTLNLLVFFVGLIGIGIILGVPIAFAFGLATVAYLLTVTDMPLGVVVSRIDEGISGSLLMAIPLFVLLGNLLVAAGLAQAMVGFLSSLLGHLRGGLMYVLIVAMYLVSGISGAKAADMAAVAPVLFPEMKRRGEDPGEMTALLAASGAMAETIPPSIVLIMIGSVTGVSISALFTGGLLPALVGAIALSLVIFLHSLKARRGKVPRAAWRTIAKGFIIAVPALALPFLIRISVVAGVATATEVATVGTVYTFIVGVAVYRQFDWSRFYPILIETVSLSGAILFVTGVACAMAWALIQSGIAHGLTVLMTGLPGGSAAFLALSIVIFAVLGSLLEGIPVILVFGPLLFPIAQTMGVNEVHYAIIVILSMGVGLYAPPFGVGYYFSCAIGKVSPDIVVKKVWPYLGALLVSIIVVAAVPWITTGFLP